MTMNRTIFRAGLAAGCAVVALASGTAAAQPASAAAAAVAATAADTTGEGDIIVTARRQNERLADVPASVTVLTSETLARTGVTRAEGFVQLTPGVTIVTGTAEAGDTQINIRGLNGARDAESSVALVVDGILKTNTALLNQAQGTLRQIEVLKGPQGALYGRNAAAGAVVVTTVKPGDRLEGAIVGSYGEQQSGEVNAYVAGPISPAVGFVLAGNYRRTDGFYTNILTNAHTVDDQEAGSVDGRIVAKLGDATTLDLKGRYQKLTGASINFNAAFHLPNFAAVNPKFNEDVNDHPFRYYNNIRPTNKQRTIEFSAKVDHEFDGDLRLSAWAMYSDVKQSLTADGTSADFARYITNLANPASQAASTACFSSTAALTGFAVNQPGFIGQIPVPFIFAPANGSTFGPYSPTTCDGTQYQVRNQKDYSGEVRLVSTGGGPLQWQIGAYYLHIDRLTGVSLGADLGKGIVENLYNPPGSTNPTSQLFEDKFRTNVYAGFGSADYAPTEAIKLGVALRYDIEDRKVTNQVPFVTDPITGAPINPGQAGGPIAPQSASFKQLEPKITASWKLGRDANLYADWGVGFKSGGFNNQGSSAIVNANFNNGVTPGTINAGVTINDQYRKERSSAFEVGLKGGIAGNRITYDIAGYYTRVRDMQFFEFFVGGFGLLRVVSNIDKVDIWGGEANVNARLVEGWNVFGGVNVTGSEIKANRSRPDTVGNKSPYTADYTLNAGTQMVVPVNDALKVVLRADYRVTGPTWFHTVQAQEKPTLFTGLLPISALALPGFVGNANYKITRREAFGVANVRFGLEGRNWKLTAFADNLFDRKYLNEVIPAIEFGGSFISPGARRRIGVEAGLNF